VKITFIGGGNMAAALIGGLLGKGHAAAGIRVVEPQAEARARLAEKFGVACADSAAAAAPLGEAVVLAVKPQQMRAAARALQPQLAQELVISIAAGIRLADLSRWLGGHATLVRCMPNTPALIGAGVSGLYAGAAVGERQRALAEAILGAVGTTLRVLFHRGLAAVGAGNGFFRGGCEAARGRDLSRDGQARRAEPGTGADAAPAGYLQGRHHRARAREHGGRPGKRPDRAGAARGKPARARAWGAARCRRMTAIGRCASSRIMQGVRGALFSSLEP
jgi:pyrroline-5-carboxylate reductase